MQINKIYYSILFLFILACADNSHLTLPNESEQEEILDIITWNIENYPKHKFTNNYSKNRFFKERCNFTHQKY